MSGAFDNTISNQYLNFSNTGGVLEKFCDPQTCPTATAPSFDESALNSIYNFLNRDSANTTSHVIYGVAPTLGINVQPYTPVVDYSGTYTIDLQY